MASVNFIPFTALQPVELKYQYNVNEPLNSEVVSYDDGLSFKKLNGLQNYQDVSINKGSCFALTTAISLSTFFSTNQSIDINQIPGTVYLQSSYSQSYYLVHDGSTDTVKLSATPNLVYINPVRGTGYSEIVINGNYLQVDDYYPYTVRANSIPLVGDNAYRQQFYCNFTNGTATIYNYIVTGEKRYLSINTIDNTLRATGVILNNSVVNDYIFLVTDLTVNQISYGHLPNNKWITYYMDNESAAGNKSIEVNKTINDNAINFLVDFPYDTAINTGVANINIANLKTDYTPGGGPAPVDNSYIPTTVTSNFVVPVTAPGTTQIPQLINPFRITSREFSTSPFTIPTPTSTSELPVSLSAIGPVYVRGTTIHTLGVGTVTIIATQDGNLDFYPAAPYSTSFDILQASQAIAPFSVDDQLYTVIPFNITIPVATSNLPVVVTVQSGPATISGNTITMTGTGRVVLAANQAGSALYTAAPTVTTSFNIA
jgi:hypothetical protein